MNSRSLDTDLSEAHSNPCGATVHRLIGQILLVLICCHAEMPFSTSKQYAVIGEPNTL